MLGDVFMEEIDKNKKVAYRIGLTVFILLVTLTIGEFFIGKIAIGWTTPLVVIGVIKASFIVRDYMHVSRLFGEAEEVQ
jgi:hypothetical protein